MNNVELLNKDGSVIIKTIIDKQYPTVIIYENYNEVKCYLHTHGDLYVECTHASIFKEDKRDYL